MVRFDYTPYEKSLMGDPSQGMVCNLPGCTYEGGAAPESVERDQGHRRVTSLGCMAILVLPWALGAILGMIIASFLLPWWQFSLATAGIMLLVALLVWRGLHWGRDYASRIHTVYICPDCGRDKLIPLNSRRGQMIHARNQRDAAEQFAERVSEDGGPRGSVPP